MAPPLSPLSLVWLQEGLRRSKVNSTAARRRAAGIPDMIQYRSTSAFSAGTETGRSHRSSYVYAYSEVLHLWRQVIHRYHRSGVVAVRSTRL
jgi:hypothetical protein